MPDRFWPPSDEHPPGSALFLYVEGELEDREADAVRQHLNDCWECRTRCEEIQDGIHVFVEYRRDVLIPELPPPPAARHRFRHLLREEDARLEPKPPAVRALLKRLRAVTAAPPRAVWIAGTVSAVVVLLFVLFHVARPPAVSAAEFLRRASVSSGTLPAPHRVVYQEVELRQGSRVLKRELVRGVVRTAKLQPPLDAEWIRLLSATPIDWRDPLGADRFAAWRDEQTEKKDVVSESGDLVTLTTIPLASATVQLASLIVRRADWHPIAKRVEFPTEPPVEVREVSYEMREEAPPETGRLEAPSKVAPAPAPEPSAADLERSEIRLREAFHQVGADLSEVPEIAQQDRRLEVHAIAQTPERKDELLAAMRGIPYLKPQIILPGETQTSGEAIPAGPVASSDAPVYATEPRLAQQLWDFLGDMDAANNYLDMTRDSYFRALADAAALERLAGRYSGREWQGLPADVQAGVNRLAGEHIESIRKNAPAWLSQLSKVLDEMLRRNNVAVEPPAPGAGCDSWQSVAPALVEDMRQLQTSFRRLFLAEQVKQPVKISAEELLGDSVRLRSQLQKELNQLLAHCEL